MTREQAINYLRCSAMSEEQIAAVVGGLTCEDAISREAVLRLNELHHGEMPNHVNHKIWEEIKELPSVNPVNENVCHTCKHYLSGEFDGSCGSYICKNYSGWEDNNDN